MEFKFIFIVLAIIFWVVKTLTKNSNTKNTAPPKSKRGKTTSANKSIDDIFNDFVKEIETKNKQTQKKQPVVAPVQKAYKKPVKKAALDWQQVDSTHMPKQKQLIDHEDYHGVSHRIDSSHKNMGYEGDIAKTEGEVFQFDASNIDLRQMLISKEILDRKYT